MKVLSSFSEFSSIDLPSQKPLILTIGMFDGVHLGHKKVLESIKKSKNGGKSCLVTFKNPPLSILHPEKSFSCLYNLETKLFLLENFSIDFVVALTFSQKFAEKSFSSFLEEVREFYPFSSLILGEDAVFGKNQNGTQERLFAFAKNGKFSVNYLPLLEHEGKKISSSWIRQLLEEGEIKKAEVLLGHPFVVSQEESADKE